MINLCIAGEETYVPQEMSANMRLHGISCSISSSSGYVAFLNFKHSVPLTAVNFYAFVITPSYSCRQKQSSPCYHIKLGYGDFSTFIACFLSMSASQLLPLSLALWKRLHTGVGSINQNTASSSVTSVVGFCFAELPA